MTIVQCISSFFACVFLIVPFSVCAGEIPQSHVTDPLPMAVYAASSGYADIWAGGVGGGFRAGTQTLSFSAGATYGLLIFGGKERHHLVPITVSYGRMSGASKEPTTGTAETGRCVRSYSEDHRLIWKPTGPLEWRRTCATILPPARAGFPMPMSARELRSPRSAPPGMSKLM